MLYKLIKCSLGEDLRIITADTQIEEILNLSKADTICRRYDVFCVKRLGMDESIAPEFMIDPAKSIETLLLSKF